MITPAQRAAEKIRRATICSLLDDNVPLDAEKIAAIIDTELATDKKLLRVSRERMGTLQLELAKLGVERRECARVMKMALIQLERFKSADSVTNEQLRKLIAKMEGS